MCVTPPNRSPLFEPYGLIIVASSAQEQLMSRFVRISIVLDPAPCVFAAIRFTATLLAAGITSVCATAADVKIGEVPIRLPPPVRYCELDVVVGSDAARIGPVRAILNRSGVRLLAMSTDCAELNAWRLDPTKDLDHWAEYQTAIRLEEASLPDTPDKVVGKYCAQMRAAANQSVSAIDPSERSEEASSMVALNQRIFLGVVAEEPLACFGATVRKIKTEAGAEKIQVGITASAIIKGKVVLYYLFAPYTSRNTVGDLLTTHRENVSRLQRANAE
jgi:hypothetical protein